MHSDKADLQPSGSSATETPADGGLANRVRSSAYLELPVVLIACAVLIAVASACFDVVSAVSLADAGTAGGGAQIVAAVLQAVSSLFLVIAVAWIAVLVGRRR